MSDNFQDVREALKFVDEFQGDDRCSLNRHYAEALASGYRSIKIAYDAALQRVDTAERERDAERNEAADCRLYLRTCVDVLRAHGMDGTPWYDGLKRMAKMDALDAEDHI